MTTVLEKKRKKKSGQPRRMAETHTNMTVAVSDFSLIRDVQEITAGVDIPVTMTAAVRLSLRFFKQAMDEGYFNDLELADFIQKNKKA